MRQTPLKHLIALLALLCLASPALAGPGGHGPKTRTYIAIGDSVAFGYSTAATTGPSFGDQGYVRPYADWLATQYGGRRPKVINLAVPGETTFSFFQGGMLGEFLNLNYSQPPVQRQSDLLLQAIQAEQDAGHVVKTITVQLGANDILNLITPAFLALPPAQQQATLLQTLGGVAANYSALLRQLRRAAPHAHVLVVGYHNPLAADPSGPLYPISVAAVGGLNQVIAAVAASSHVRYVDVYSAFSGHEAQWTYMATLGYPDGIHPTAFGYGVIADLLASASGEGEEESESASKAAAQR